jgi:hypothetical protein
MERNETVPFFRTARGNFSAGALSADIAQFMERRGKIGDFRDGVMIRVRTRVYCCRSEGLYMGASGIEDSPSSNLQIFLKLKRWVA